MPNIQINRLTNGNVYIDGNSYVGKAEEVQLPAVKAKFTDHKGLGMIMDIELPSGFEKMNGKIKWSSLYPDAVSQTGSPYFTLPLQIRGNLETYDSSGRITQTAVVCYLTVRFKDALSQITIKQNDPSEQESEFTASYYKLEIGGQRLIEIDAFSQIYFVNDSDQMVAYRAALGL